MREDLTLSDALDEIEAYANGELGTTEIPDTLVLFNHPRTTRLVRTPNNSVLLVSKLKELHDDRFADLLGFEGVVVSSPQCPHLKGEQVDFLVDCTGAIGFFSEEQLPNPASAMTRFAGS